MSAKFYVIIYPKPNLCAVINYLILIFIFYLQIAVGPFHALALSNENEAYFWGTHGTGDVFQTPTKVSVQNVVDIAAANGCYISALKTTQGKVYFWGFAYGIPIPKPVLTNFTSMEELFSSLDTPQMLKPVESDLERPRLEKLGLGFDDRVKLFLV